MLNDTPGRLLLGLMMLMYDWRSLLLRLKLADPDCYTASYGPMGDGSTYHLFSMLTAVYKSKSRPL